ncbi:MAG: 50S ribosomal protein L21 [Candidatus Nomurabacteria bacterium]|nr:MAG: 50S ribosomal protein L21 [Candidatus Nomurabacteria bacterium]
MPKEENKQLAVIAQGGRQYVVRPNAKITVNSFTHEGDTVTLDNVLLVHDGKTTKVGKPQVEGATVTAKVLKVGKGKKVVIQKYKPKVRYRRKTGHRQGIVELQIQDIHS